MSTRRKLALALTLTLVGSLGLGTIWHLVAPPYADVTAYRYDPRADRLDYIEQVLGDAGLPIASKWVPEFVDEMLQRDDTYAVLELAFPTRDFPSFLPEAIRASYYAYSAQLHAQAPAPYRDASRRLVRSWFEYPLGTGAAGFHAFLDSLVEVGAPNVFLYEVTGSLHPDTQWTARARQGMSRWCLVQYWLGQTAEAFLGMSYEDQALVLRSYWTAYAIVSDRKPDQELLDKVERIWRAEGSRYVRRPAFRDLDPSTPFARVAEVALDQMGR